MISAFRTQVLTSTAKENMPNEYVIAEIIAAAAESGIITIQSVDKNGYWRFSFTGNDNAGNNEKSYLLCFYRNPDLTLQPTAERAVRASDFIMQLLDAISQKHSYHIVSLKRLEDPFCTDGGKTDEEKIWVANARTQLFSRLFAIHTTRLSLLTPEMKQQYHIEDGKLPVLKDDNSGHELDMTLYLTSGSVFRRVSACVRVLETGRVKIEGEPDKVTLEFQYHDSHDRAPVTSDGTLDDNDREAAAPILAMINNLSTEHKKGIFDALVLGERSRFLGTEAAEFDDSQRLLLSKDQLSGGEINHDDFPILRFMQEVAQSQNETGTQKVCIVTMIPSALFIDAIPPVYTYAIGETLGKGKDKFFSLLWNEATLPGEDAVFEIKRENDDPNGELIGIHGRIKKKDGNDNDKTKYLAEDARILLEHAYIATSGEWKFGNAVVEKNPQKCCRCQRDIYLEWGILPEQQEKAKLINADTGEPAFFCHECIAAAAVRQPEDGSFTYEEDGYTSYLFPYSPYGGKADTLLLDKKDPEHLYTCAKCNRVRYASDISEVASCVDCGKLFCDECKDAALKDGDCVECGELHKSFAAFLRESHLYEACLPHVSIVKGATAEIKLLTYDIAPQEDEGQAPIFRSAYFSLQPKGGRRYFFILRNNKITLEGIE